MFADDLNLFISDENIGELFRQINKKRKDVSTSFKANTQLAITCSKLKIETLEQYMKYVQRIHSIGILYTARLIIPRK